MVVLKLPLLVCLSAAAAGISVPVARSPLGRTGPATFQQDFFSTFSLQQDSSPKNSKVDDPKRQGERVPVQLLKTIFLEKEPPVSYEYEYLVQDPNTGDNKHQKEKRNGDMVQGYFAFIQPDGLKRIVEYTSGKDQGFKAEVRYEPTNVLPAQPVKVKVSPTPVQIIFVQPPPSHQLVTQAQQPQSQPLQFLGQVQPAQPSNTPLLVRIPQIVFSTPSQLQYQSNPNGGAGLLRLDNGQPSVIVHSQLSQQQRRPYTELFSPTQREPLKPRIMYLLKTF